MDVRFKSYIYQNNDTNENFLKCTLSQTLRKSPVVTIYSVLSLRNDQVETNEELQNTFLMEAKQVWLVQLC